MTATPYAPVTVKTDAGAGALTVLAERQPIPGRRPAAGLDPLLPLRRMAAQVLGHVDQVSERELKMKAFRGVLPGTIVGQEGLEYYYDRYLRGRSRRRARGGQRGRQPGRPASSPPTPPLAGHSLKLTLDLGLQQEGEKALLEGIENARGGGKPATAGAFVAIDPRNGQVLAIGSYPSFDPNSFAKPLTPAEYAALVGVARAAGPLADRAVNGDIPDRLDVQADHGDGGARRRRD